MHLAGFGCWGSKVSKAETEERDMAQTDLGQAHQAEEIGMGDRRPCPDRQKYVQEGWGQAGEGNRQ